MTKYRFLLLGILCVAIFETTLTQGDLAPFLSLIIEDYQISNTEAGLLLSAFVAAFAVVQIPIGVIADVVNPRKILVFAFAMLGAGALLFDIFQNFPAALISRAIMGLGAGCVYVTGLKLIVEWFPATQRGKAMGVYASSAQLGFFVSISALPALMNLLNSDWRLIHLLAALPTPFVILAAIGGIRRSAPPTIPDHYTKRKLAKLMTDNVANVVKNRKGWTLWVYSFIVWGSYFGLMSWAPTILEAHGLSIAVSALVGSMIPLASIPGFNLGGVMADRSSNKRLILISAVPLYSLSLYFFLLALPSVNVLLLTGTLLAVGIFSYVGTMVFAWVFDLYPFDMGGTAAGIMNSMIFFGSVAYTVVMGFVLDLTKSYSVMILLLIATQSIALVSAILAPKLQKESTEPLLR